MKYEEDANYKLFWAIIVALIGVTCMIVATGCSHTVLVGECHKVENQNKNACKTLKPWE